MWQMYAIFEEFLENHITWNHQQQQQHHHHHPVERSARSHTDGLLPSSRLATHQNLDDDDHHYAAFRTMREDLGGDMLGPSPELQEDLYQPSVRERKPSKHRGSSGEVWNPLLETISTIEDLCESDDYSEFPSCEYRRKVRSEERLTHIGGGGGDGDKDSIGYAGSNSIDSGYKSSCPTPELSDGSFYGNEMTRSSDAATLKGAAVNSAPSAAVRDRDLKPRIAMGTRVMHKRQYQRPQSSSAGNAYKHADSELGYDVNLDHLMYLRQTLLSAIQQCHAPLEASSDGEMRSDDNVPPTPRAATPSLNDSSSHHDTRDHMSQQRVPHLGYRFRCTPSPSHGNEQTCPSPSSKPRRMPSPNLGSRQLRTPSPSQAARLRRISSPSQLSRYRRAASPTNDSLYHSSSLNSQQGFRPYCTPVHHSHHHSYSGGGAMGRTTSPSQGPRSYRTTSPNQRITRCRSPTAQWTPCPPHSPPSPSQKTVRFGMDRDAASPTLDSGLSRVAEGRGGGSGGQQTSKSKPILKDPICANLRAQLEFNPDDPTVPTLEEEIDTLLYGRAEYFDLGNVNDFPCNYVTMIEDKYRKSSIAKVKKLRDKSKDSGRRSSDNELGSIGTLQDSLILDEPITLASGKAATSASTDNPKETGSGDRNNAQFPEVAKYMLEIIEDLQRQKLMAEAAGVVVTPASGSTSDVSAADSDLVVAAAGGPAMQTRDDTAFESSSSLNEKPATRPRASSVSSVDSVCSYDSRRLSGADYHLYEEILYDLAPVGSSSRSGDGPGSGATYGAKSSSKGGSSLEMPPPLPARPSGVFHRSGRGSCGTTSGSASSTSPGSPSSAAVLATTAAAAAAAHGSAADGNAPKQRLNLYSLFREQSDRRSISLSLEQEWRLSHGDSMDDEYGFKVLAHPT